MRGHEKHAAEGLSRMEARMNDLRSSFSKFAKKVEESSAGTDVVSIGGTHFQALDEKLSQLVAIREKQYDSRKALGECGDDEARAGELREELRKNDAELANKMMATLQAKSTLRMEIHQRMVGISDLQTNIRKMGKTTNGYYDSLHSLDRYFVELGHVEHIASAFAASMDEVLRRKKFKLKYERELTSAFSKLKDMCDLEGNVRDVFWAKHGVHLPTSLMPGLEEKPPQALIELPAFDTPLPDLGPLPDSPTISPATEEELNSAAPENPTCLTPMHKGMPGGGITESAMQSPFSQKSPPEIGHSIPVIPMPKQQHEEAAGGVGSSGVAAEVVVGVTLDVSLGSSKEKLDASADSERQSILDSLSECRLNNAHLENQLSEAMAQLSDAEREIDVRLDTLHAIRSTVLPKLPPANSDSLDDTQLLDAVTASASASEELLKVQQELLEAKAQAQVWRQKSEARMACYGFEEGDLALFVKDTDREGVFEAYNVGCPNHFLQLDALGDLSGEPTLLGRILSKTKKTAGKKKKDPFKVGEGTDYYLVTVQPMHQKF